MNPRLWRSSREWKIFHLNSLYLVFFTTWIKNMTSLARRGSQIQFLHSNFFFSFSICARARLPLGVEHVISWVGNNCQIPPKSTVCPHFPTWIRIKSADIGQVSLVNIVILCFGSKHPSSKPHHKKFATLKKTVLSENGFFDKSLNLVNYCTT